ncbi:MAG: hypothetical protein ABI318_18080 [Chthoniobacteraceae bacterium]
MDSQDHHEDSSPENRELAGVLWKLGRLLPGYSEINWQESRKRCGEVLSKFSLRSEKSRRIADLLEGQPHKVGGDEHHIVRVSSDPCRVYKVTHGDNFGCRSYFSPVDPELAGHLHGETNADPFFYLERWGLLNSLGEYQTRFEGIIPPEKEGWLPRICVSQPQLPGTNPTPQEIREALAKYEFREISIGAFYQPTINVLLTDAVPRNVRIVEGLPIPFDAIAQLPSERVRDWAIARCETLRHQITGI